MTVVAPLTERPRSYRASQCVLPSRERYCSLATMVGGPRRVSDGGGRDTMLCLLDVRRWCWKRRVRPAWRLLQGGRKRQEPRRLQLSPAAGSCCACRTPESDDSIFPSVTIFSVELEDCETRRPSWQLARRPSVKPPSPPSSPAKPFLYT